MQDIIKAIHATPIPNLLIAAGLLFLLLGFVNKLGGFIEVSPEQKRFTIPIGLLVLTVGLVLSLRVPPAVVDDPNGGAISAESTALHAKYIRATTNDPNPPTNLRNGPGSTYQIVARIKPGEIFFVDPQGAGDWLPAKTSDNMYGYIHKPLVREVD
ncbi:MAG: SH3 domain-containing protein [Synechococcus sp.]